MEQRIKDLQKRLAFLGYRAFQVDRIVQEAVGDSSGRANQAQSRKLVRTLEKYEKLGLRYLQTYSK